LSDTDDTDRPDPGTDPGHDLRRDPQDPDARQPGELLTDYWSRAGSMRATPRQDIDPPWYAPDDAQDHDQDDAQG
jgi:hypothetical protein